MDADAVFLDNSGHANIPVDSAQPMALRIESPSGNITVRGNSRPDVLVSAEGYDAGDDDAGPLLAIEARGNVITIKPHAGPADEPIDLSGDLEGLLRKAATWIARSALRRHDWPDITVEIPRNLACRLDAHAASGDIDIEDLCGTFTVRSASGDLHLSRVVGQLTVQSASGDISLEESVVALTARIASGDLHINETVLDGLHVHTASGDCYVEGTLLAGHNARAETASGDVHLSLEQPDSTGATLTFRTVAGSVSVDDPFRRVAPRRWQLGTGEGPQIEVATVSGDLNVDASFSSRQINREGLRLYRELGQRPEGTAPGTPAVPPAPPTPPVPPVPPAPPAPASGFASDDPLAFAPPPPAGDDFLDSTVAEDAPATPRTPDEAARIALLEAVARGELDIEEALRHLEGIEATNT